MFVFMTGCAQYFFVFYDKFSYFRENFLKRVGVDGETELFCLRDITLYLYIYNTIIYGIFF